VPYKSRGLEKKQDSRAPDKVELWKEENRRGGEKRLTFTIGEGLAGTGPLDRSKRKIALQRRQAKPKRSH